MAPSQSGPTSLHGSACSRILFDLVQAQVGQRLLVTADPYAVRPSEGRGHSAYGGLESGTSRPASVGLELNIRGFILEVNRLLSHGSQIFFPEPFEAGDGLNDSWTDDLLSACP